jgi:hypothetical protein
MSASVTRLDANETMFFSRELETIDTRTYDTKFPLLKGRMLIPKINGVGEWDEEYTYRQFTTFGEAEIIADDANDLPVADATGKEFTSRIKPIGMSYKYTIPEIRAAMQKNKPLDAMKARAALRATEELIDTLLAFGSTVHNMSGFANAATVDATTFVPVVKDGGSDTEWDDPSADPELILSDINQITSLLWGNLKEAQGINDKMTLVVPATQYAVIATMPIGDNVDKTVLRFALDNSPFLEDIVPWHKLTGAGDGGADRMICYVKDPQVLGALIPLEYQRQEEQLRGITYTVPTLASCGGTVVRYPVAMLYGDGI